MSLLPRPAHKKKDSLYYCTAITNIFKSSWVNIDLATLDLYNIQISKLEGLKSVHKQVLTRLM